MSEVNATPHAELIAELMNPNNPKNEREHAATREIERLRETRQAIAELESQKPFCYVYKENGEDFFAPKDGYYPADAKSLYTHPPQRTWVGLTDKERFEIRMHSIQNMGGNFQETLCKAIEAKLKGKNCAG